MHLVVAYVALIVIVNASFSALPHFSLPGGGILPAAAFLVGAVFVLRDLAQRKIGHGVLPAMLLGGAISYIMADPMVAVASMAAFLMGEAVDWLVFTITRRPLADRILYSSALGTPIDTVVFLSLLPFDGALNLIAVVAMTAAKMTAAIIVWTFLLRQRRATI